MNRHFYKKLLEEWCPSSTPSRALICVFEKTRDIPYGSTGERNPENIVQENLGSCSGKHILLNNLFRAIGYQSKVVTCLHYFNQALPPHNEYPEPLSDLLHNHRVIDFHHFIKLKVGDRWLNVDVTWDAPLKDHGFPVNMGWKGDSDTTIAVQPIKFFPDTEDVIGLKKRLIAQLSREDWEIRNRFMNLLTDWLRQIRAKKNK